MDCEITLFIPTHNRPKQLHRLLRFVEGQISGVAVVVADSSDPEHLSRNSATMEALKRSIRIKHLVYSGQNYAAKCDDALGHVETETLCFCGDDDLIVPSQLMRCSRFLLENKDFSHARGKMLTFLDSPGLSLKRSLRRYPQFQIAMEAPMERLHYHLKHYISNFYSVRRTEATRRNLGRIYALDIGSGLQERLLTVLDLLDGKGAVLPDIFMFRQKGQTFVDESGNVTFWDKGLKGSAYAAELARNATTYLDFIRNEVRTRVAHVSDHALERLLQEFEKELAVFFLDKERPKRLSARRVKAAIVTLSLKLRNAASILHEDGDAEAINEAVRHIEHHRMPAIGPWGRIAL